MSRKWFNGSLIYGRLVLLKLWLGRRILRLSTGKKEASMAIVLCTSKDTVKKRAKKFKKPGTDCKISIKACSVKLRAASMRIDDCS
ncbi:OLC1v1027627C2 [Oldenlandia corymbosa var. corymbosa]|uniref:OLC1v1027627C2 n=1 Tax=Oldenlandia corymbosa var. corymbosa TaxID=529605 RepID=A0AAV1C9X4_OLDCO|nr:OLC1v1027627C2 [Oldenlandia corymbosa var. corymbosa]